MSHLISKLIKNGVADPRNRGHKDGSVLRATHHPRQKSDALIGHGTGDEKSRFGNGGESFFHQMNVPCMNVFDGDGFNGVD